MDTSCKSKVKRSKSPISAREYARSKIKADAIKKSKSRRLRCGEGEVKDSLAALTSNERLAYFALTCITALFRYPARQEHHNEWNSWNIHDKEKASLKLRASYIAASCGSAISHCSKNEKIHLLISVILIEEKSKNLFKSDFLIFLIQSPSHFSNRYILCRNSIILQLTIRKKGRSLKRKE